MRRIAVFTYNAHAHPQLNSAGSVVISYNVNTADNTEDPSIYRPRFVEIRLRPG